MMGSRTISLLFVFLLCRIGARAAAADHWEVLRDSHFEIYSQVGGDGPRKALIWFERLRTVCWQGGFLPEVTRLKDVPVLRVIGFRSEQDYAQFRLRPAADAYFAGTNSRDYVVLPSIEAGLFADAAHEYAHFVMHASGLKLPDWLSEGLADYFSTVRFTSGGYELGADLPTRSQTLQREKWIPLPEFFNVKLGSQENQARKDLARFYSQSWAMADLLMSSTAYRSHLAEFVREVNAGVSSQQAFAAIYGKTLSDIEQDLANWLSRKRMPRAVRSLPAELQAPISETLSNEQAGALLADLLAATGNLERAREQYLELARRSPGDADLHAALGSIAFNRGDRDEALRQWRQALEDGTKDAELCFRFAQTADEAGAPQAEIREALERAITLHPNFDDARFKLGLLESNAGHFQAAIDQLRAMHVPHGERAYGYWVAMTAAFTEMHKRDDAVAAAHHALDAARTDTERENAKQMAYVAATDLKAQFVRDAQGNLQLNSIRVYHGTANFNPFVEPSDDIHHSEGQLSDVLCTHGKLSGFRVTIPKSSLVLDVPDPAHVLIENGPKEFYCGPIARHAVSVDYAVLAGSGTKKNVLRGMVFETPTSALQSPGSLTPQEKITPLDEATRDTTLIKMRTQLMASLRTCNVKAILAMADAEVELGAAWKDFDGTFADLLDGPKRDQTLCSQMYDSLRLGGRLSGASLFESNYVALLFSGEPGAVYGDRMYQVVTQKDVPVYEQPDSHSRVVSYLSYDVVLTKLAAGKPWANVEYTQSRFGYVRAEAMANPTGLIVKLQRSGDGWKIKGLDEFYE